MPKSLGYAAWTWSLKKTQVQSFQLDSMIQLAIWLGKKPFPASNFDQYIVAEMIKPHIWKKKCNMFVRA